MAVLPDIDTSNVGLMAYYNILDETVTNDFNPVDAISAPGVLSYEQFDNGIKGKYDIGRGEFRAANYRVKSDGWVVVWINRERNYVTDTRDSDKLKLLTDLLTNPEELPITGSFNDTEGVTVISELFNEINQETDANASFDSNDVSWYSYEFDSATSLQILDKRVTGAEEYSFSYPSTISNLSVSLLGYCRDQNQTNDGGTAYVRFEGISVVNTGAELFDINEFGAMDLLDRGLIPQSGTTYNGELDAATFDGNGATEVKVFAIFE
jgi:hypothetical protein